MLMKIYDISVSYKEIRNIFFFAGSLGKDPNCWLFNFSRSLRGKENFKLIFPSQRNVANGYPGAEGCLPYQSTTHEKQEWLNTYLQ